MEVEYELAPEDLLAFQRYHRQNPPQAPQGSAAANVFIGVFIFIASVTTALFFLLSGNSTAEWYLLMVPFVGVGAALTLLGIIVYAWLTAGRLILGALKHGRNAEKAFGRRRVAIDAEAVRNTSGFASSAYYWHGIDRVGATRDHAFFYINTTTAVIVPRAAFPDGPAFKEFVDTARRYYRLGGVAREAPDGRLSGGQNETRPPGDRGAGADEAVTRRPGDRRGV